MNNPYPILVVYAVSHVDVHLAEANLKLAAQLGGAPNNPCLLCLSDDVKEEHIRPLAEKVFPRVYCFRPDVKPDEIGWPAAPNAVFRETVLFCFHACQRLWLFHEADLTPCQPGWMSMIEAEVNARGRPFWGCHERSWLEDPISKERTEAGKHLVGTAVYPRDVHRYTRRYAAPRDVAFDVWISRDILKYSTASNLISHNWLTHRYHLDPDRVIRCESREGRLKGQRGYSLPHDVYPERNALLHGSKDDSAAEAIRQFHGLGPLTLAVGAPPREEAPSSSAPLVGREPPVAPCVEQITPPPGSQGDVLESTVAAFEDGFESVTEKQPDAQAAAVADFKKRVRKPHGRRLRLHKPRTDPILSSALAQGDDF